MVHTGSDRQTTPFSLQFFFYLCSYVLLLLLPSAPALAPDVCPAAKMSRRLYSVSVPLLEIASTSLARSQCVGFSLTRICFDACNFLALIRARRGTQLHAGPLFTHAHTHTPTTQLIHADAAVSCLSSCFLPLHCRARVPKYGEYGVCHNASLPFFFSSPSTLGAVAHALPYLALPCLGPIFLLPSAEPLRPVRPRRLTDVI